MIRLLNLFSGFAFVGFGFLAFNLISEIRNYVGQELVAWFVFYALCFCLTFIVWALTYFYMRDVEDDILDNLEDRIEMIRFMEHQQDMKKEAHIRKHEIDISDNLKKGLNKRQMELDL